MNIQYTVQSLNLSKSPMKYFNKIPLCLVNYIQSYFSFTEQVSLFKLSSMFINTSPLLTSFKEQNPKKQAIKYSLFLVQLEKDAGLKYVPFLNQFMSINIFSIPNKQWCSITLQDQALILIKFLTYRYEITKQNKFFINLIDMEIYQLYYSVLCELPFKRNLKIHLYIYPELEDNINDIIPLFTIITPKILYPDNDPMYENIQEILFIKKIEAFHYRVYDTLLTNAINYFKQYPNHLYSIDNENTSLIKYNESSITAIELDFTESNAKACKNIKAKKINCSFSYENDLLTLKLIHDMSQVTSFGECRLSNKQQCDQYISLINSMPRLNTIETILSEEELVDDLLLYFLKNISNDIKLQIKHISVEHYQIENIYFLADVQNTFQNLQSFIIDSDTDYICPERLEIDYIYITSTGNTKDHYEFILFLLKNNLRNKKRFSFSIKGNESISSILDFLGYLHNRGETEILNSFSAFDYALYNSGAEQPDENVKFLIKRLNYFAIDNEIQYKFSLPLLKNIERIQEISVSTISLLKKYNNFITDKQPDCLIYLGDDNKEIRSLISNIHSVKYLVVSNEVFNSLKIENPSTTIKIFSNYRIACV